jgi:circadian clock protein KaiC
VPFGTVLLIPGCVGSGKTIFSLQFIAEGVKKYHERGLYVTFEETEDKLREQAHEFGWDFAALEKKKMARIIQLPALTMGEMLSDLEKEIRSFKPQRLVIDSFTFMTLAAHTRNRIVDIDKIPVDELLYGDSKGTILAAPLDWNTIVVKKMVTDLVLLLQQKGITTILTSEVSKNSEWYSRDTVSEFACDGVFLLKATSIGSEVQRTIELVKLRNSNIKAGIYDFVFYKNGIKVINP